MSDHFVPKDVEARTPILFWEPLEFILAVSLFGFGIIGNAWIPGAIAGTSVLIGSRYLKRGARRGAAQHVLWSLGISMDLALRKFPPSWANDFTE